MDDLIYREQTIECVRAEADRWLACFPDGSYKKGFSMCKHIAIQTIFHETPSARPKGKWKHDKDDALISGYCSECGWESIICETDVADMPYCPNCGAEMEVEHERT